MTTSPTRVVGGVVVALAALVGCGANDGTDGMQEARTWCHDRHGYIANTGWYEYQCVINNTPVYIPSPKDK